MAQARPVSIAEQDALQLLRITSEISQQDLPALQGMAASALSIIGAVANFKSNKKEWKAFGRFVQDAATRVVLSLVDHEETREAMEVRMERVFSALTGARTEIDRMQNLNLFRRVKTFRQDSRKISALENQIHNAVESFLATPGRTDGEVAATAASTVARYRERLDWWLAPSTVVASVQKPSASGSNQNAPPAQSLSFYNVGNSGNTINVAGNSYGLDEEQLALKSALERLRYAPGASWNPALACLPGTRLAVLSVVDEWSRSTGPQRVFLLKAVAGSGKSAIAHSIAQMFHANGHLASSFFFSRNIIYRDTPQYLFTTIARDIASRHPAFAADVGRTLEHEPALASAPLSRQFKDLICAPLRRHPTHSPIVVVIDALDEGISKDLEVILSRDIGDLPADLRLFITSRPTRSIERCLGGKGYVKLHVIELDSDENQQDIATYVDVKLQEEIMSSKMGNAQLDEPVVRDLVAMSEGLFFWLAEAFDYLRSVSNPAQEIRLLVSTPGSQECSAINRATDALCATILDVCVGDDWHDEKFCRNYQHIIGVIVAARRPLSLAALRALHGDIQSPSLEALLEQFSGIIVVNAEDQERTVRILHKSFRGFVMGRAVNASKTRKFHIVEKDATEELAHICLQTMNLRQLLVAEQITQKSTELAASLHNLYSCLYRLGRQREALTAIQEAVNLYRAGVAERPVVFGAHLVNSLHHLSIQLVNCEQPEEALKVKEEATMLRLALLNAENEAVLQCLDTVLNKIKRITDATVGMVDTLARVHTYAKIAWKVLSSLRKGKETDTAVLALLKQIEDCYSSTVDVDCLPGKIQQLETVIIRALEQTTECGIFFREYTAHGFSGRVVGNDASDRAQMISELQSKFGQLRDNVNSGLVTPTAFLSSQTTRGADRLAGYDLLHDLKPTNMNAADRSLCLPGTQQDRLEEVIDWLLTPSGQNVLWLHGAAGLGKSTIATTIAAYFGGLHRRGAFLFFDRNAPLESSPSRVITTLAFQLAQQNTAICSAVSAAIKQRPELLSDPLATQFQSLLVEPLAIAAKQIEGPIIVILDALDECGNTSSRRNLLEILSKDFNKLPPLFRILITSRPEHDIKGALSSPSHIFTIDLSTASDADMQIYIQHEMQRIYRNRSDIDELPVNWPGDDTIRRLVTYAAGLFIWAATAMKLLFIADDPVQWLADLRKHKGPDFTLHDLYEAALLSAREWGPGDITDAYRRILGLIIISQVPLKEETISALLGFQDGGRACRIALRRLGSVIRWSEGHPARTLHKSFPDYLTNHEHCASKPWFIDLQEHQHPLAVACLRTMNERLHFNMCNLTTSHIPNIELADLSERVERDIPQSVSYPCLFWGHHMHQIPAEKSSLLPLILDFFQQKFLYWLEVLSLLGEIRLVSQTMTSIKKLVKDPGSKVDAFAQDALAFSRRFGQAMAFSTPHIYISCIPFAPQESVIKQQYAPLMKKILGIKSGMDVAWPVLQQAIEHTSRVLAVAFSPDGLRIASGSQDGFVRVWDAETGALIAAPFEGHTKGVSSVAFSPDGQWIASGSADYSVCVWNAETGALIAGPFAGHIGTVYSVAFSPDGKRIASGSADKSVRVWNLETGVLSAAPFKGHTDEINSVVFSPDGRRIVSGSDDRSVRVCDAETGALVAGPFEGHTETICSVAFSPDGKRIASGSADKSVQVWDADTGVLNAAPFKGHTNYIRSVSFSPNGQCIASGSDDGSIRVSDAESGALVAGPFHGHTDRIRSVAFSPDGQRIASASDDKSVRVWRAEAGVLSATPFEENTGSISSAVISADGRRIAAASGKSVRVWDVETGALSAGPFEGHAGDISSVAFSPDGQRIASGSQDRSVRVWDTQTGALVAGPFEGHTRMVFSVAFSPDGRRIASGSYDESIRVWDAETGALVAGPFKGHTNWITSVAFSPDGRRIASGSWDCSVRVWDAQTGALIGRPSEGHTNWVTSVVFSPDGQHIASGSWDQSVRMWNAETGVLVAGPFEGHTSLVHSVSFSPNGQYIASGSEDQSLRIWNAQTGDLVAGPFEEHANSVHSVAFSSDGHCLLSASHSTIYVDNFTQMVTSPTPQSIPSAPADPASPHDDTNDGYAGDSRLEHGWMRNRNGGLLFWVPPEHREGLFWPHTTQVISILPTRLDLEDFVHGEDWAQCYEERC
ncbi:hypothetical protein HWV62_23370 [Athelia sp. TMB]|nr:hypothetical protein HWV62_23370 [Athelia sp. TMB]